MRILVTGGAGYIGTELVSALANEKSISEIIVYDNLSRKNFNFFIGKNKVAKVKFINGDLLDSRRLQKSLQNVDVVYHLAAMVTTPFSDNHAHSFEQINNWGTAELVQAVENSAVSKFVYLSSASVYGSTAETIQSSSHDKNPRTYYGITKLKGEEHVRRLSNKGIETLIFRCANVFGYSKSMRFEAVINKFMFEANFTNKIIINGNGNQSRAFIHVQNVVDVLKSILNKTIEDDGDAINLSEFNASILEIAEVVKSIYPDLEMQFINQHLPMKEIRVVANENVINLMKSHDLSDYLNGFKLHFSY